MGYEEKHTEVSDQVLRVLWTQPETQSGTRQTGCSGWMGYEEKHTGASDQVFKVLGTQSKTQ